MRPFAIFILLAFVGQASADPNAKTGGSASTAVVSSTRFPGDFDWDFDVDFADFLAFVSVFGTTSVDADYEARMDMDGSGAIDFVDFVTFTGVFGRTYTRPPWASDRDALIALYHATDGDSWTDRTNWLTDTDLSTWHGVTVSDGRVTRLQLDENNLSGSIQPELGNLSKLEILSLNMQELRGPIPAALGSLSNLTRLYLGNNELSGAIPPELGNLFKLETLYLNGNQLSGPIPPALGSLSNLTRLYLGNNYLSGTIPPELGNLSKLTELWLYRNALSGTIPPELGNLSKLEYLRLRINQLSGAIPPALGDLSNLKGLYLAWNQLSGAIPSELDNLSNLASLDLSYNAPLRGPLPQSLTTLPRLSRVIIRNTRLCAPLDAAFQTWLEGLRVWDGDNCQAEATPSTDFTFPLALGNTWKYRVMAEQWLPHSSDLVEHIRHTVDVRWQIFGKESVEGVEAYRMESIYRYTGGPERGKVVTGLSWYTIAGDTLWAVASQLDGLLFPSTARLHKVAINATQDVPNPWNVAVLVFPLKVNSEWDFGGSPRLPSKKVVEAIEEISVLNQTFETFKVVRTVDTPFIQLRTEQWFASIGLIRMKEEVSYVLDQIDVAGNVIGQLRSRRIVDMELESYQLR